VKLTTDVHGRGCEICNQYDAYGRWCETCNQFHGLLYICDHYPDLIKKELLDISNGGRKEKFSYDKTTSDWICKIMPPTKELL